jgi:hypothetical protein
MWKKKRSENKERSVERTFKERFPLKENPENVCWISLRGITSAIQPLSLNLSNDQNRSRNALKFARPERKTL